MTNNKKADLQTRPKSHHTRDTSVSAQPVPLMARLQLGPVDTCTRHDPNLMMPAVRIDEDSRIHHGVVLYFLSQPEA